MLGPILSLGMLTWASFLYIGVKARRPDWLIAGVIYAIAMGVLFYFSEPPPPAGTPGGSADWVGGGIFALWAAGIVHALLSNKSWLQWRARNTIPWYLNTPTEAPQPVPWARNSTPLPPQLAATGVDSTQYYAPAPATPIPPPAAALLDVNTAGPAQIAALPGFTEVRARQVTAARTAQGGFANIEQFADAAGLAPHEHHRVRGLVTCTPPAAGHGAPGSGRVVDF
ncbi:MAG: ComEA family DNA-binding protein [Pseudonocardiaceae bacterium]